ncbi:MAG: hypothetical protein ACI94Y_001427 [Maribacter sp.]
MIKNLNYHYDPDFNSKGEADLQGKFEGGGKMRFDYENKMVKFADNIIETDGM